MFMHGDWIEGQGGMPFRNGSAHDQGWHMFMHGDWIEGQVGMPFQIGGGHC
jgi:hypothetical protein